MKFYSTDTYTIYPPQLEFRWDDTIYSSSLDEIQTEDIFISLDENPGIFYDCLLYTSPSPRDRTRSRMPSSA